MAFNSGVSGSMSFRYLGSNKEESKYMVFWQYIVKTDSVNYLTSNQNAKWKVYCDNARDLDSGRLDASPLVFEGYTTTPINTDINDEKVVASGMIEIPYYLAKTYESGTAQIKQIRVNVELYLDGIIQVNTSTETGTELTGYSSDYETIYWGLYAQPDTVASTEAMEITNMNGFNDEENPVLTHSGVKNKASSNYYKYFTAYISFDGNSRDIVRDVPHALRSEGGGSITFDFTDEEKAVMYQHTANTKSKEIYVYLASGRYSTNTEMATSGYYKAYCVKRTLTIINGNPVFSPVIKDTNATTKALTGDENILVRYHSNAYVESNIALQKGAGSIASHKITLGGKSTTALTHTFNQVESNKYVFTATDSRGFSTTKEIEPPFVDYVKLTCAVDNEPIGTISRTMKITIHGNYYEGSFGNVNNNLGLTYRYRVKGAEWGNWITVSDPSIYGSTYKVDIVINDLDYLKTYELQAMATDRLNTISTPINTVITVPTFDWSRNDFNFNVPVNFSEVVDFNKDATFQGEAIITGTTTLNGGAVINGDVNFNGGNVSNLNINTSNTTFDNDPMADYIIETGTASMGSNGTWKWQKWKSGKAECWGKRNYGNMGFPNTYSQGLITSGSSTVPYTIIGQSEVFTQDLPYIFNSEPDVIEINIIKSNGGAWVVRGFDTDSSDTSTGGFAICRNGTTNMSAVHLGFHIIGTWK